MAPRFGEAATFRHLRYGVVVGSDANLRNRIEPVRVLLEDKLGVQVDLYLMEDLGQLTAALALGDVDFGRLSASAFAAAQVKCKCLIPLVSAKADQLSDDYYSVLLTREKDGIASIAELKGTRLGVGPPQSIALKQLPFASFRNQGIAPETFFSSIEAFDRPTDGIKALVSGQVDAALAWSSLVGNPDTGYSAGTLNDVFLTGETDEGELEIVWRSEPIPYNVYGLSTSVPQEVAGKLRDTLIELRDADPGLYGVMEPQWSGGFRSGHDVVIRPLLELYENR
ncbi:MAG: phosphate/phosphite/phosphonate ABC transporter substrate-binding protein [Rhodobacteraceae bacterium]|nr:phosphate/phosphite/phosphonate ABC transporter substrate-binding protein [Paracoccaceae bacterium]